MIVKTSSYWPPSHWPLYGATFAKTTEDGSQVQIGDFGMDPTRNNAAARAFTEKFIEHMPRRGEPPVHFRLYGYYGPSFTVSFQGVLDLLGKDPREEPYPTREPALAQRDEARREAASLREELARAQEEIARLRAERQLRAPLPAGGGL